MSVSPRRRVPVRALAFLVLTILVAFPAGASYTNFESSHVHPIALTPSGDTLLAVNTPDGLLEVFDVNMDGSLTPTAAIPVGAEPVTVVARTETEAWVVNNVSDSIAIVDLTAGLVSKVLQVGDEPTDVVFAGNKAFVAASQLDRVEVYDLGNLDAAPQIVDLFTRLVRALAVSNDGNTVYAVGLLSGNRTTVIHPNVIFREQSDADPSRLAAMNLKDLVCDSTPPAYPPLPPGITRDPMLPPPPEGVVPTALIVRWDEVDQAWEDEVGTDWSDCVHYELPDHDLFMIDVQNLSVTSVDHVGTSLFEVSVHPTNDKIYVPNTDARNFVRFEHPLGVEGHVVDNLLSIVDPAQSNALVQVDLNAHINRGSDPATNEAERVASISQPGMMVWEGDGSHAYLTAIGSRKIFRVDGSCTTGSCIVGGTRATPEAVEVGNGPSGVVLREPGNDEPDRLYVLNRIDHNIAIVDPASLELVGTIGLHDPSDDDTKNGRIFLYDAISTSGHGDMSCASCHISGDQDGMSWNLGNPEGAFTPYTNANDNVRFITPENGLPEECDSAPPPDGCSAFDGFDPQKGPMTTQTLRGMLEPLHWRGDRPTFASFNPAFVVLNGAENIAQSGPPAGLSAQDMELFRQFALAIRNPSNPFRSVDDSIPNADVQVHGALFPGNPTVGKTIFETFPTDGVSPEPCIACHASVFGTAGGKLGGVTPAEPTSADAAALFNGPTVLSAHNDLKVGHLRNVYRRFGPTLSDPVGPVAQSKVGFGYTHEGAIPDLYRFLSAGRFNLSSANQAKEVRDVVSFVQHFPGDVKPAVGRQVAVPAGAPPTGTTAEEDLLTTLISVGDLSDANRHCELVATTFGSGRVRNYHLDNGNWVTDVAAEAPVTTTSLRTNAGGPITFTCGPLGSGQRLGGDRDMDGILDGEDCAPSFGSDTNLPTEVLGVRVRDDGVTTISWDDQTIAGSPVDYDVLSGDISVLRSTGLDTTCIGGGLGAPSFDDARSDPVADDGYYYLIRATNACGSGGLGTGRESQEGVVCP